MRAMCLTLSALVFAGCDGAFGPAGLQLEVRASAVTFPQDGPFAFTVTATNIGTREIIWGQGSSSCQLDAVVRVDGRDYAFAARVCTDDLVPQGLEPGASRTEQLSFEGEYFNGEALVVLTPGTYEFRGLAGEAARSAAVEVEVLGHLESGSP